MHVCSSFPSIGHCSHFSLSLSSPFTLPFHSCSSFLPHRLRYPPLPWKNPPHKRLVLIVMCRYVCLLLHSEQYFTYSCRLHYPPMPWQEHPLEKYVLLWNQVCSLQVVEGWWQHELHWSAHSSSTLTPFLSAGLHSPTGFTTLPCLGKSTPSKGGPYSSWYVYAVAFSFSGFVFTCACY